MTKEIELKQGREYIIKTKKGDYNLRKVRVEEITERSFLFRNLDAEVEGRTCLYRVSKTSFEYEDEVIEECQTLFVPDGEAYFYDLAYDPASSSGSSVSVFLNKGRVSRVIHHKESSYTAFPDAVINKTIDFCSLSELSAAVTHFAYSTKSKETLLKLVFAGHGKPPHSLSIVSGYSKYRGGVREKCIRVRLMLDSIPVNDIEELCESERKISFEKVYDVVSGLCLVPPTKKNLTDFLNSIRNEG